MRRINSRRQPPCVVEVAAGESLTIKDGDFVALFYKVRSHVLSHITKANEADLRARRDAAGVECLR
jgi:hypothetical protein